MKPYARNVTMPINGNPYNYYLIDQAGEDRPEVSDQNIFYYSKSYDEVETIVEDLEDRQLPFVFLMAERVEKKIRTKRDTTRYLILRKPQTKGY